MYWSGLLPFIAFPKLTEREFSYYIICGYFFFFHFVSCLHRNYILRFLLVFCFWFRGCWIVVVLFGVGRGGGDWRRICLLFLFWGSKYVYSNSIWVWEKVWVCFNFCLSFSFLFSKGREIIFSMLTINVFFFFWGLFISIIKRQVFLLITFSCGDKTSIHGMYLNFDIQP